MPDTKPIIEAQTLSKKYYISHQKSGLIKQELENFIKKPLRFFSSIPDTKRAFWALKNISFTVQPGEIVGIIGKNGSGKSTLLKILAGIVAPTTGKAILRGNTNSVLEIGTGFHLDLTGRENIFLSGSMLGLKRAKIKSNFDSIVSFSGIKRFLDTPVKFYSSGMYVRLAFSVAVHLKPNILLIDEVLSVGDAEFQKKSLNQLELMAKKQGITVLIVSHNTSALRNLCDKGMYLKQGKIHYFGTISNCINHYLKTAYKIPAYKSENAELQRHILSIKKVQIIYKSKSKNIKTNDPLHVSINFQVFKKVSGVVFGIAINSLDNIRILDRRSVDSFPPMENLLPGRYIIKCAIKTHCLLPGQYILGVGARNRNKQGLDYNPAVGIINIQPKIKSQQDIWLESVSGFINTSSVWTKPKLV